MSIIESYVIYLAILGILIYIFIKEVNMFKEKLEKLKPFFSINKFLAFIALIYFSTITFHLFNLPNELNGIRNLDLNSLGDFLAGIFAPITFLWLIHGQIQINKDNKERRIEKHKQAQPYFSNPENSITIRKQNTNNSTNRYEISFEILNSGSPVTNIYVLADFSNPDRYIPSIELRSKINRLGTSESGMLSVRLALQEGYVPKALDEFYFNLIFTTPK